MPIAFARRFMGGELVVLCLAVELLMCSCSAATKVSEFPPGTRPATVALYRSRCGSCHAPVEPGTFSHAVMAQALERHKVRAHLTDSDREALVAALSSRN